MVKLEPEKGFVKRFPWKVQLLYWESPCPYIQEEEKSMLGPSYQERTIEWVSIFFSNA